MDGTVPPTYSEHQKLSEEQIVGEGRDIISCLPEHVFRHIVSFLSAEDALSDWFPRIVRKEDRSLFLDFVQSVLLGHDGSDITRLCLAFFVRVNSYRLNSWISAAIRHNVKELDLTLPEKQHFLLPSCLFTCKSLIVFQLFMDCVLEAPTSIHFSNLKTLKLYKVTFSDDDSTHHLFSSCPVLQELALVTCGWKNIKTITISIPTLKRFTIENDRMWDVDVLCCVIKIYAANLIYLDCINLSVDLRLCELSSLVDASMGLACQVGTADGTPRTLGLFTAMYNVKKLSTMSDNLLALTAANNLLDCLPTFYNMTHLVLTGRFSGYGIRPLRDLLEKSPKLEFIDFTVGFHPFEVDANLVLERVPSCFNSSLKAVRISEFDGMSAEMIFTKFLLENATVLERLTVHGLSDDMEKKLKVSNLLNKLPRGSKSCVIELL